MEISLEEIVEILKFIATLDCVMVEVTVGDVHVAVRRKGAEVGTLGSFGGAEVRIAPQALSYEGDVRASKGEGFGSATPSVPVAPVPGIFGGGHPTDEWVEREASGEVVILRSPMVGTVYRAKEPGLPPFVEIGDTVQEGDVLCLVEIMKLFHSMTADVAGVLEAIFIHDGALVEYAQPLMVIRKS